MVLTVSPPEIQNPPLEATPLLLGEKRVALRGISWQSYQQILHAFLKAVVQGLPTIAGFRNYYASGNS